MKLYFFMRVNILLLIWTSFCENNSSLLRLFITLNYREASVVQGFFYLFFKIKTEFYIHMYIKVLKGESFCPGMKISSNYKDHTFGVLIYRYLQIPQLTGI